MFKNTCWTGVSIKEQLKKGQTSVYTSSVDDRAFMYLSSFYPHLKCKRKQEYSLWSSTPFFYKKTVYKIKNIQAEIPEKIRTFKNIR